MTNPQGASSFDESDRDLRVRRLEARIETLEAVTKELHERIEGLLEREALMAMQADDSAQKVATLAQRAAGKNRSSASKREMTNEDAEQCLTGDTGGLGHKSAAEAMGLTYAQVYSCRLGYTFKGVHKRLRESRPDFVNKWERK